MKWKEIEMKLLDWLLKFGGGKWKYDFVNYIKFWQYFYRLGL